MDDYDTATLITISITTMA